MTNVTPPGPPLGGDTSTMTTTTTPTTLGATRVIDLAEHSLAPWENLEFSVRARLFGHLIDLWRSTTVDLDHDLHYESDLYHDAICLQSYSRETLTNGFAYGADNWGTQMLSVNGPDLPLTRCAELVSNMRRHVWTVVLTITEDKYRMAKVIATITKVYER